MRLVQTAVALTALKGIGGDNVDVLMATISRMTTESGAYTFVRHNPRKLTLEELERLRLLHGGDLSSIVLPRYEISGAITQLDENVDARSLSLQWSCSTATSVGRETCGLQSCQWISMSARRLVAN